MKYGKYIILALVLAGGLFSCQRDEDIAIAVLNINSEVIEPSYTSANVECYVECNTKLDNVSIEYALTEDFADAQSAAMTEKEGKYRAKCENLLDDTTYYVRYIVSNRLSSMTYKEMSSFRTLVASIPKVYLDSVVNIWDVRADAFAHIEFDGGVPITEWGIVLYVRESNNDSLRVKVDSMGQSHINLQELVPNTSYVVCAYAINKVGVSYSDENVSITTFALPEIQTEEIEDIQLTSALLSGVLVFNGNDTATIKGFCWSEEAQPTIESNYIGIDTTENIYTYRLSNLKEETQYYVRAYAKNKIGVVYGKEKSFTTQAAVPPTVSTSPASNVGYHTACVGGNVTSDGGVDVMERGICYSITENPTIEHTKVVSGKGLGDFLINLENLTDSTTYYVRAYAINKKGVNYGEQVSFMTKGYKLATITTSTPTNISYTSTTIGGNVISDGGASVTERGVVYSTSQNPTVSDSKVSSGSGTGSFICNLTNLQPNTTYYIRAYAINKKGTNYGEQQSLTTLLCHYFSISSTKKIVFSPGNLQYHPANDEWRFAEKQYDYIGKNNENISSTYNGWLDLFGWSSSSSNFGVSTSTEDHDYVGSFVDWGTNQIGADAPNTWRTLSQDEWMYIFYHRPNAQSLFALGSINGVNGTIILPDYWTTPTGVSFVASTTQGLSWEWGTVYGYYYNSNGNNFSHNTYTSEHWSKMEQAGAVFLPASGFRRGTDVISYGYHGNYWSNTFRVIVDFNSSCLRPQEDLEHSLGWYYGLAVRLAQDFNIATSPRWAGK